MTPSLMSITNPRTLAIINLGALVNRVRPEFYLEALIDKQAHDLFADVFAEVFGPEASVDEYLAMLEGRLQ